MPLRIAGAYYGIVLHASSPQGFQVHYRDVLQLVYFKELYHLPDRRQLSVSEETPRLVEYLCAETPHEVFLRSFDKSCRVVAELGFFLLLLPLLQKLLPMQDVVLLAVCELLTQWVCIALRLLHIQVQIILGLARLIQREIHILLL